MTTPLTPQMPVLVRVDEQGCCPFCGQDIPFAKPGDLAECCRGFVEADGDAE